jgi:3D (Asp-Asp-Asp) domain-containing protein
MSRIRVRAYINVGEKTYVVTPGKKESLKAVLDRNNIVLNEDDIMSHDLNAPLKPLHTVKITRVKKERRKIVKNTPFKVTWRKQYVSNLRKVEVQKGVEKDVIKTIDKIFHNGILYDIDASNEKIITKEYYRLVLFDKNDKIEKIYDLSKAKRMEMVATAYYPGDPLAWGDGTVTFLGQKMQRGIVAVDPRIIPLRTRLFIFGYGYGYAGDTGNLIKGYRVDLGVNNAREEVPWMFRDVTVYILEKSNTY